MLLYPKLLFLLFLMVPKMDKFTHFEVFSRKATLELALLVRPSVRMFMHLFLMLDRCSSSINFHHLPTFIIN